MLGHRKESIEEMLLALEYPSLFEKQELATCKLELHWPILIQVAILTTTQ